MGSSDQPVSDGVCCRQVISLFLMLGYVADYGRGDQPVSDVGLCCRLWEGVSKAVMSSDMQAATNEKYIIEEEQRKHTRERKLNKTEWVPRYFEKDYGGADWIYKHAE